MSSDKKEKKSKKSSSSSSSSSKPKKDGEGPGEKLSLDELVTQTKLWITSTKNKKKIKYRSSSASKRMITCEFSDDDIEFEIFFPETSNGNWKVTCDSLSDDFGNDVRKELKKGCSGIADVLTAVCTVYTEYEDGGDDDDDDGGGYDHDDDGFGFDAEPVKKTREQADPEVDTSKFQIPSNFSGAAVQAIAKELASLQKGTFEERLFEAAPQGNNIHIWEVKIYGIPKDDKLWEDMQKLKMDCIVAQVHFAPNYPFAPPFIRLLRPRFQLRTGHVTIGGAICTFALSNEGWNPMYRLEQIIVDIRCNFTAGNGRLDLSNRSDYTESEAMDAFRRLCGVHGWTHWKK